MAIGEKVCAEKDAWSLVLKRELKSEQEMTSLNAQDFEGFNGAAGRNGIRGEEWNGKGQGLYGKAS